ncbi:MAG TPA: HTTM domain-containing protein [Mycobacteriales bacterium]
MLRRVVYAFVVFDMFVLVNDVVPHGYAPASLYRPILVPRLLHLPAPTPAYVQTLRAVLVTAAVVGALGRLPRAAGWVVAVAYLDWIFLGFSYGKVDHDHLALVVALFTLPLAGPARGVARGTVSEAAAWTLRCIQVAAIATYFLSAYAKLRHGGWWWANSATFAWALSRRATSLAEPLIGHPAVLVAGQWGLLVMELLTPVVLFLRGRALAVALGVLVAFHVTTYLAIEIHFLPTVVCLLAFVPLERLAERRFPQLGERRREVG